MKLFRILATVLLVCWMALIFGLSHQTADTSSKTSGGMVEIVANIIYPDFEELSESKQEEILGTVQFWVRKTAHFTLYAILGGLAFLSIITYNRLHLWLRLILSGGFCLIYSISDEIHQLFIAGRSGELRDVCIDFAGSLSAILILFLISRCKKLRKYI